MKKIKVSVLMLTYNHEKYIEKAIDSVMNQLENSFILELVVSEDNSPDKTKEILKEMKKKYKDKIMILNRTKNLGPINNLKDTLERCDGEYIAYIEGDDYWIDNCLIEKSVRFLEENKEYSATVPSEIVVGKDENVLYENIRDEVIENPLEFIVQNNIPTLGLVFRNYYKTEKNKINKLFENITFIADFQIKAYLLSKGKIRQFKEKMTVHRLIFETSSFASQSLILKSTDSKNVFKNINEYFDRKYNYEIKKMIYSCDFRIQLELIKKFKIKDFFSYKADYEIDYFKYLITKVFKKVIR